MAAQGPWEHRQGLERLQDLPAEQDAHPVPAEPDVFLEQMRDHAYDFVEHELLEDRLDLWQAEWATLEDAPGWWTLQPPDDLRCWALVILQDLKVSSEAASHFVALVHEGPDGFAEGLRIIAHLAKDKQGARARDLGAMQVPG